MCTLVVPNWILVEDSYGVVVVLAVHQSCECCVVEMTVVIVSAAVVVVVGNVAAADDDGNCGGVEVVE
jgi:hypothetical protein